MSAVGNKAAARRKIPNPLDYVDGQALGRHLRHVDWPAQPKTPATPTTVIQPTPGRPARYRKGRGRPD